MMPSAEKAPKPHSGQQNVESRTLHWMALISWDSLSQVPPIESLPMRLFNDFDDGSGTDWAAQRFSIRVGWRSKDDD